MYELYDAIVYSAQADIIKLVIGLAFFVALLLIFMSSFKTRKSKEYRQLLSDMYVAGKIKQIANEENIDLAIEEESFRRWLKKQSLRDLDDVVEEELKEKIEEAKHKEKKK